MKDEPAERLDPRAKTLWRLTGILRSVPILAGGGLGSWGLMRGVGSPIYVWVLPALGTLVLAALVVFFFPGLRWRRWRYEIRAEEVDLQRGIVWVSRTLVPLARIQHVDTRRGPLERRLGLSTVVFYTAAGPNEIPELSASIAADVRDRIAELARTRDEL